MRKLILVFTVLMTACVQIPLKSTHVTPHVVKEVDTIERYDPCEFWDGTEPVTVDSQHARYNVGGRIECTYHLY